MQGKKEQQQKLFYNIGIERLVPSDHPVRRIKEVLDLRLFSEISRLIFAILQRFYEKAAKRPVRTGMVLAYQTSGEFLRWNPHFHCLVLEGGFDDRGKFVHIPLGEIQRMSEYFRRVVIKSFLKKELINAHLATSLIKGRKRA